MKTNIRLLLGCLAAVIAWQPVFAQTPDTNPPPNIVFIFADDLGYGDIESFGAADIKTPHIDSLGENGAKFTQFYSASPVCTPSRAALLTGRYPVRMGIHHVFQSNSYDGMPGSEITIAEHLKPAGYSSALIGKWHLGDRAPYLPLDQGFDVFFGIPYSNDMSPLPMMEGNTYTERKIDQTQLTKRLTTQAVNFIDRNSQNPFFLYLAHPMPHVPIYRSKEFEGISARGPYGDVIQELDWSVGEVLSALRRNNLTENTLVVFTSDNGPWLFMGKTGGSSGPLRNGKGTTFEGGVRVPLLAQFPNNIAPGQTIENPASMLDWFPTFSALANIERQDGSVLDGQDISQLWQGGGASEDQDRVLAFYSYGRVEALRAGDWKLKRPYDSSALPVPSFIRILLKGEFGLGSHGTLLFNLKDDPFETQNLAKSHPEKLAQMQDLLEGFEAKMADLPPSITDVVPEVGPPVQVLIGAIVKFILSLFAIILIIASGLFFWLGRRSGRKKYKT